MNTVKRIFSRNKELEFEGRSLTDSYGFEWLVSGTYYADMDLGGEFTDDGFKDLVIEQNLGDVVLSLTDGIFPDEFSEQVIARFQEKLAEELYNDMLEGAYEV